MNKNSRPTLSQVASLAGVSTSSASLILNNREGVSFTAETIERVHTAAAQLGYMVKSSRSSRGGMLLDEHTIVVLAPTPISPYYATLVQSIDQSARSCGFETMVYYTYRDPQRENHLVTLLRKAPVAGVIFTMAPQAAEPVEELNRTVPVVVIGDRDRTLDVDTVETRNFVAGVMIARHLLQLGHTHIAYISTTLNSVNTARTQRLEGLQQTFREECPEGTILVRSRDITPVEELNTTLVEHQVGFQLCQECLKESNLTAFVAVNDMVAYGVMDCLLSNNHRIPEDYSVCAFDNNFPSRMTAVSLTTVDSHIEDKGHNAFDILHTKICQSPGDAPAYITRIEYPHQLIVRGSTAAPRIG